VVPFALLLALACAKPLPTLTPVAVSPLTLSGQEWRTADQVFVITDASGTMYSEETFPEAKALTRSFVAAMPAGDVRAKRPGTYHASLIGFGGDERMVAPLAPFDRAKLASTAQGLDIMGNVDGMGGETPLDDVLGEVAVALDGRQGPAALVIFSDGRATYPDQTLIAGQSLVENYRDGVCIHAVHVGDHEGGRQILQQLVGLTGCGSLRRAADLKSASQFTQLARDVFTGEMPTKMAGPCEGVIRLRGINFDFDRSEIRPDAEVILDVAVDRLRECPDLRVVVEGHTDSIGTDAYNQGLSERRADATRRYLVGHGISSGRLQTRGFGEAQPLTTNETDEGRAQNRRVELRPQ
jgi:OOP family OmpA-OmpF porin